MQMKGVVSLLMASALVTGASYVHAGTIALPHGAPMGNETAPISASAADPVGVTSKDIYESGGVLEIKMRIPQVVGLSDQHFQAQFNYLRELHATKAIAEAKETMEETAAKSKGEGYPFHSGVLQMDHEVKSVGRILSFTVTKYTKYSIAPGATGVPEFSIPMADLKGLLKGVDSKTENAKTIISGVVVQDQEIAIKPYTSPEGVTMIPLRAVCQSLGYQVNWYEAGQMIEIFKGAQWTQVFIGQDTYSFAKMLIRLGTAPVIRDDVTFVPTSFAEQVLRADVAVKDGALIITQK